MMENWAEEEGEEEEEQAVRKQVGILYYSLQLLGSHQNSELHISSGFLSAHLPLRLGFWRTSLASPLEQTLSWRLQSAPALTGHSPGARRSAACRAWSGTGA